MAAAMILVRIVNVKRIWHVGVMFAAVSLVAPTALALDPMGPPAAGLAQGQIEIGIDYSHSKMDLELSDGTWIELLDGVFLDAGEALPFTLKNFKASTTYANIGFGATDRLEAFVRVGGTTGRFGDSVWQYQEEFDGSTDFAVGGGIKATFFDEGALQVGGLLQASWAEYNGTLFSPQPDWGEADRVEIEIAEVQIAVGATYTWAERFSIYGGPFLHFVSGELNDTWSEVDPGGLLTSEYSWEIDEDSVFGGYAGAQVELTENCSFNIEYQRTAAADAVGMSLLWRK